MPLARFNFRSTLAFLTPYKHTLCLCISPESLDPSNIIWMLPFYVVNSVGSSFIHAWSFTASAWTATHWDRLVLSTEEISQFSWDPSFLSRTVCPWDSSKQIPEQAIFCCLGQLLDFLNIMNKSQLNLRGYDFLCFEVVKALALKPIQTF